MAHATVGGSVQATVPPNPCPHWLSDKGWEEVCRLPLATPVYEGLMDSFRKDGEGWRLYADEVRTHYSSTSSHP